MMVSPIRRLELPDQREERLVRKVFSRTTAARQSA